MKKVLLLEGDGISSLVIQRFKEEYGEDIEIVTLEQAQEQNLLPDDFVNIPTYQIKMNPMLKEEKMPKAISVNDSTLIYGRVGKGGRAQNRTKMNNFNQKQKRK